MSDKNKISVKKSLVRNTQLPVQNMKVVPHPVRSAYCDLQCKKDQKDQHGRPPPQESKKNNSPTSGGTILKLDHPEPYSTLKLNKKLDDIVKLIPKKEKVEKKLAVDEKITRKVNFPNDQPIYRDLIPLTVTQAQPTVLSSRGPLPLKDKEPVLMDFLEPKVTPDYYCLPNVKLERKGMLISANNLKLYHVIDKEI